MDEKEDKEKTMNDREQYSPGPASGAQVRKDGEKWTLILVRELRHSPEKVWQALTDPAHLREWAPFEADGSLGTVGTTVKLTTVGAPTPHVSETRVTRADAPSVLEYNWGGNDIRWELEAFGGGTRLTLWHNFDRRFISMSAATKGFEFPPDIVATPVVLKHRGRVGSRHSCFGNVRRGRSHRGELHRGSNRTQAPIGFKGSPLAQMRRVGKRLPDFFRRVAQLSDENEGPLLSVLSYLRTAGRIRCVLI